MSPRELTGITSIRFTVRPRKLNAHATEIADRIVSAAREVQLPDGESLTVSVGVAAETHGDAVDAVRRADEALHSAKELGRDRAVASEDHTLGV